MTKNYEIIDDIILETDKEDSKIIVVYKPTIEEKNFLVDVLNINKNTIESCLDPDEVSRVDVCDEYISVMCKIPKNKSAEENIFNVTTFGIFLFSKNLLILSMENVSLFDNKQIIAKNLKEVFLKVLDQPTLSFTENLKIISIISEEIEEKINESMENKFLINMFTLEKSLVYYLSSLNENMLVFEKLKTLEEKLELNTAEKNLLIDYRIECGQCYKQAEIHSNILASLMDARVSIVSNNLNILMKTLTKITIMIMLPSLVVSIFSMNVRIPVAIYPDAFWGIMILAFLSVLTAIIFWKVRRW